jgi:hypothetical protein
MTEGPADWEQIAGIVFLRNRKTGALGYRILANPPYTEEAIDRAKDTIGTAVRALGGEFRAWALTAEESE